MLESPCRRVLIIHNLHLGVKYHSDDYTCVFKHVVLLPWAPLSGVGLQESYHYWIPWVVDYFLAACAVV